VEGCWEGVGGLGFVSAERDERRGVVMASRCVETFMALYFCRSAFLFLYIVHN
jgi:hypothetical protein